MLFGQLALSSRYIKSFLRRCSLMTRLGRSSRHLLTLPHGLGWSQPECRVVLSVCVPWEGLCEDVRSVLLGGNSLQGDGAEL